MMDLGARAFWDSIPTRATTTAQPSPTVSCLPDITLPANGSITFYSDNSNLTLAGDAVFTPFCENEYTVNLTIAADTSAEILEDDEGTRETFVTSTLPVVYALAATTVVAYMLVIMLFITPRTYVSGGTVVLGAHGFSGTSSAEAGIGIGGRPWLQKVAALSVAISLTIATASTFDIAAAQYAEGFMDSKDLQEQVLGGMELKIIMTVSDAFLWLAQAQTLIRLFPRHREKVIIKWTALFLISLCLLFNILNDFYYHGTRKARHFVDAVPALSYLFQLALGLLYCAWVMYYAVTKKRYAFYHPRMRNMCLLALLSIVAILVPVVFFVVDISKPEIARWGDYVRWVGACAASVVVWEWVERIEALERDDKRDGVLGREIFDGDEMLEVTPSTVVTEKHSNDDSRGGMSTGAGFWPGSGGRHRIGKRNERKRRRRNTNEGGPPRTPHVPSVPLPVPQWPARPSPVATPISRTNTASAESTIYAVRYHPIGETSEPIPEHISSRTHSRGASRASRLSRRSSFDIDVEAQGDDLSTPQSGDSPSSSLRKESEEPPPPPTATTRLWSALTAFSPFHHARQRPPPEVSAHVARRPSFSITTTTSQTIGANSSCENFKSSVQARTWDIVGKVSDYATAKTESLKKTQKARARADAPKLPVMRIPAPRRAMDVYKEEVEAELEEARRRQRGHAPRDGSGTGAGSASPRSLAFPRVDGEAGEARRQGGRVMLMASETQSQSLAYRGSLAFAPALHEEWARQEHDALGTGTSGSSEGTQLPAVVAPMVSPTVHEAPALEESAPAWQGSYYVPLGSQQQGGDTPPEAPPAASTAPVTPGVDGLPVVRIPPPPLRSRPAIRPSTPNGPVIPEDRMGYRY